MTLREAIPVYLLLALSQAVAAPLALAQSDNGSMSARLSAERLSDVQPGEYNAGDQDFILGAYGDTYLMRLGPGRECYVLYADRAGLGGRVLKYDSGATALKVSVWGGITLYTHDAPGGVPATRVGDLPAMPAAAVTVAQLNEALADETRHLAYIARYTPRFTMDPAILSGDDGAHALAFDTLVNTEAGLEKLLSTNAGRNAVTRRIDTVRIIEGSKPTIRLSGRTLLVSFVPASGLAGRASSRAIAFALGKLLSVEQPA